MTGEELDREMRAILNGITPENVFTSAAQLYALGFGARQSWEIAEKVMSAKEEERARLCRIKQIDTHGGEQ